MNDICMKCLSLNRKGLSDDRKSDKEIHGHQRPSGGERGGRRF